MESKFNFKKHLKETLTNRDKLKMVLFLIARLQENGVCGNEEVYEIQDDGDFKRLIDLYGVSCVIELAEDCFDGFVIAGPEIPFENVVCVDGENCEAVFTERYGNCLFDIVASSKRLGVAVDFMKNAFPEANIEAILEDASKEKLPIYVEAILRGSDGVLLELTKRFCSSVGDAIALINEDIMTRRQIIEKGATLCDKDGNYVLIDFDNNRYRTYEIKNK